jgi:hypothetical protein
VYRRVIVNPGILRGCFGCLATDTSEKAAGRDFSSSPAGREKNQRKKSKKKIKEKNQRKKPKKKIKGKIKERNAKTQFFDPSAHTETER